MLIGMLILQGTKCPCSKALRRGSILFPAAPYFKRGLTRVKLEQYLISIQVWKNMAKP